MKSKKTVVLIIILVLLIIALAGFIAYTMYKEQNKEQEESLLQDTSEGEEVKEENSPIVVPEKKVEIFQGDERPVAVMIDNHTGAWPQAGLNKCLLLNLSLNDAL